MQLQQPSIPSVPHEDPTGLDGQQNRLAFLETQTGTTLPYLTSIHAGTDLSPLKGNIENYIGMSQVPTGVIGPLWVRGQHADGQFFVPMATSEGALVASYGRGAKAVTLAGGARAIVMEEKVQRCPLFRFENLDQVIQFWAFVQENLPQMRELIGKMSRFAKLINIVPNVEGNQIILSFEYTTGDAAGQNMVTICTQGLCEWLLENIPMQPVFWYIESNFSGDKKAVGDSFTRTRGKRVVAEVVIPREIVAKVLKTTPEALERYYENATLAAMQAGALGITGHYANGLAAIFIACGQDVACVAEATVGVNRFEVTPTKVGGDLYLSVTLPNLIVGTVGGGTHLPTQAECLRLMGCSGPGTANKFAEITAVAILSGELSIIAALAEGQFTQAHKTLGRK